MVHLIPVDGIGGVEVAARTMAVRKDLPFTFLLLLISGRTLAPSGAVQESPFRSVYNPLAQLVALLRLLRIAPDVLICSLWRSVPVALAVKLLRPRTRLVYFIHNSNAAHVPDAFFSRLAIRIADAVWTDSPASLKAWHVPEAKRPRTISFVPDRLEPSADRARASARFVSWGRLSRQKGIDRALALVALLAKRGLDPHFDIWGPDCGELERLKQLSAELGLTDRVAFRGIAARDTLASIAAEHSFFLQLSRFEGMAMSVVEAMQVGLIPITTGAGQMGDYVRPNETGVLVDPDDLEAAAAEIAAVLEQPTKFGLLRSNAVKFWQHAPLYSDDLCRNSLEICSHT